MCDRASDSGDDLSQAVGGGLECHVVDALAHENQLDAIGEAVEELLDREGVQAKLDFIVSQ